ncbi:hypothetical protein D3C87_1815430 [compost metagenome]
MLKTGAIVTTEARDVLEALAPISEIDLFTPVEANEPPHEEERPLALPPSDTERGQIIDALGPTPVEVDDIIRHTGMPAAQVYLVLLELDIAGRLNRHPGGLVSIVMPD